MRQISQQATTPLEWVSHHIFLHSRPGSQALQGLVLPVVRDLWSQRRFLRFFFIRYGEGGPHIRLRFLCSPDDRDHIDSVLKTRAAEFFDQDGAPPPAGHVVESPFEPETERYGGVEVIGHSLSFFCLTSTYTLQQIERNHGVPQSRLLALGMRTLVRQALGFAADADELSRLTAYVANGRWQGRSPLEERADREFESRREDYVRLLAEEIEYAMDGQARSRLAETMLTDGALLLNRQIRSVSDPARWRIMSSQLHMTWNRMGIRNSEEIYLGRILWRAVQSIVEAGGGLRSALADVLAEPKNGHKDGFDIMIPASLAQLAQPQGTEAL